MSIENENSQSGDAGPNKELAGLMIQAGALDGEQAAQTPEAQQDAADAAHALTLADANRQGVAMILGVSVPLLSQLYPSLGGVYTPEACEAVAASLGPVLAKYNVNLSEWGGKYQEEIGALFVCGPIAYATVQGIKADILARAKPKAVEGAPADAKPAALATANGKPLVPGDFGYRDPVEIGLGA